MPGLRVIAESVACESTVAAEIESGVAAAMKDIITELTRPLTPEDISPKQPTGKVPKIAVQGTLEEVNRFFYSKGWTDGLPVIPPTEAAVAEMMSGTDLPPSHLVAKVIPRLGKATVEKVAINAVMAGALPTHLPVIIAAVEAVSDPKSRFDTFEVSTGSWAPFFAVNGPIRKDVRINCSSGALSPGDIANAAIGRAVGLVVKNIGGARKGVEDMGVLGNPSKWSLVLGEYEEESPWESLSVERGYKKEESTVTAFFPNAYIQTVARETNAQGILETMASLGAGGMSCLVVIPSHAKILMGEGWTKKRVKDYLAEHTVSPFGGGQGTARPRIDIDNLMILVAGGPGAWMGVHRSVGGIENALVTRKIQLPKNWEKLVAKYKNVVPVYEKY